MQQVLIVIPARYGSKRFPGKMLADLKGKSLIYRVYEQVSKVSFPCRIVVATDDVRIYEHLRALNVEVEMTREEHQSGTDRCAEVAFMYPGYNWVLNVQGDEPLIDPAALDHLVEAVTRKGSSIGTLCTLITRVEDLADPAKVKVVLSKNGDALYFSRAMIPYQRDITKKDDWLGSYPYRRHVGVYLFNRETLLRLTELSESPLEKSEKLEQLRWMENGFPITVLPVTMHDHGIDTPADVEKILPYLD